MRVPCKFPEFRELHGKTRNRYRPYPQHCLANIFAALSAHWGKSRRSKRRTRQGLTRCS